MGLDGYASGEPRRPTGELEGPVGLSWGASGEPRLPAGELEGPGVGRRTDASGVKEGVLAELGSLDEVTEGTLGERRRLMHVWPLDGSFRALMSVGTRAIG